MEERTPNSYDQQIAHTPIRCITPVAAAPGGPPRRRLGAILGLLTGVVAALAPPAATNIHARPMRQQEMPKITLAASRDTIIAGLETLVLTATREAPLDDPLAVTLRVTQDRNWLSRTSHQLNFAAGGSVANLNLSRAMFSSSVTQSGTLTATLDSVGGYDTEDATVAIFVVSQPNAAIRVSIDNVEYTFQENADSADVTGLAWAAADMPRGATVTFSMVTRSGTATSGSDFAPLSETIAVQEEDYRLVNGRWTARFRVPVTLLDDEIYEGTESFGLLLEPLPGTPSELLVTNHSGDGCQDDQCPQPFTSPTTRTFRPSPCRWIHWRSTKRAGPRPPRRCRSPTARHSRPIRC